MPSESFTGGKNSKLNKKKLFKTCSAIYRALFTFMCFAS